MMTVTVRRQSAISPTEERPEGLRKSRLRTTTVPRLVAIALLVVVGMALSTLTAAAETFTVDTDIDGVDNDLTDNLCSSDVVAGGACTLRAAIQQANASAGPDFIIVPDGDYALTIENLLDEDDDLALSGDLDITSNVVISGESAIGTVVRMDIPNGDRVFELSEDAVVRISRVTIRDGVADRIGVINGGGIRNEGGSLDLFEVIVTHNRAHQFSGGIENFGTLTIDRSTFSDNVADGESFSRGGALSTESDTILHIYNSTFYSNVTTSRGGAIDVRNNNDEALLNNVTIAGNRVLDVGNDAEGGGLYVGSGSAVAEIANTIIANNTDGNGDPNDCDGQPTSLGYNLVESLTGCTLGGTPSGDITGEDPQLGPLQNNGGETPTMALLEGSPADNAGNPAALESSRAACRATDQRGLTRQVPCDIGAYERVTIKVYYLYLPYVDD